MPTNCLKNKKQIKKDVAKGVLYFQSCVKCENCGHSINLDGKDKRICEWCGRYIFKDKKTEFLYRMKNLK